jgi:hypothetical protein
MPDGSAAVKKPRKGILEVRLPAENLNILMPAVTRGGLHIRMVPPWSLR